MMHWSIDALVASTLLIALVMALRAPVSRAFGARAAYALWALPALRFVMPSLPGVRALYVPVFHFGEHSAALGLTSPANAAVLAADPSVLPDLPPPPALPLPMVETFHWSGLVLAAWLAGVALFLAWQLIGYQRFLGRAMRGASLITRECGTDVLLSPAVDGPVAAGILKRRIFLPLDFATRYAPAERRLALLHEGAHHDRRDILANLAALAVLALHWFNPLAHRAYRLFRADQELACDETVLAEIAASERHAYGSAVVKAAAGRMPGVACALGHRAELKRRLRTMAKPVPGRSRSRAGLVLAVAAIGAGLIATAPGRSALPAQDEILSARDLADIRASADEARREADRARAEALREAARARHEAAMGRQEAAQGRMEAARARADAAREAVNASHEARREEADALREGDRARGEATREVAQARTEAAREAAQGRAEAAREAAQARAEGAREAAQGRAEAAREAAQGRREADLARNEAIRARTGADYSARQIAAVRRAMAGRCVALGKPVSPDTDWDRLALCGDTGATIAARVQSQVHAQLAAQGVE